jgi:hypothetical protein
MQYHVCNPESINRYTFNKKTNKKEGLQRKDDTSDRPMIRNYRWVAQNRKKCSWIRLFLLDGKCQPLLNDDKELLVSGVTLTKNWLNHYVKNIDRSNYELQQMTPHKWT